MSEYKGARTLQTTDGRPMTYSEHELEFTFAKKHKSLAEQSGLQFLQQQQ